MGTAYTVGDNTDGIIPKVMDLIFKRMENSAEQVEYQVRVSFIEVRCREWVVVSTLLVKDLQT